MPSFSESLDKTLHNALQFASDRRHEYATLEHLLLALILEMHQQGQTILAVLHDNQRVADYFPETMLLTPQRARWGSTPDVLPAFHGARLA